MANTASSTPKGARGGAGGVVKNVRTVAEPLAEQMGYFLWDVEYVKEGADWFLRITIDKEDGVDISDCERYHRAVDPLIDELDPIEGSYHLEVSSPGLERELRTEEHILACEGWDVELRLYAPDERGAKSYVGVLAGLDDEGRVAIDVGGERLCFERAKIAKLATHYEF